MTTDLTGALDVALEQLHGGERIPTILARHPAQAEALAPLLNAATALNAIRPVEMPSPEALSADRNDFLAEIAHLQIQPVSPGPLARLQEWIAHQIPRNPLQRKEQRRMSALLVKATLIISISSNDDLRLPTFDLIFIRMLVSFSFIVISSSKYF